MDEEKRIGYLEHRITQLEKDVFRLICIPEFQENEKVRIQAKLSTNLVPIDAEILNIEDYISGKGFYEFTYLVKYGKNQKVKLNESEIEKIK